MCIISREKKGGGGSRDFLCPALCRVKQCGRIVCFVHRHQKKTHHVTETHCTLPPSLPPSGAAALADAEEERQDAAGNVVCGVWLPGEVRQVREGGVPRLQGLQGNPHPRVFAGPGDGARPPGVRRSCHPSRGIGFSTQQLEVHLKDCGIDKLVREDEQRIPGRLAVRPHEKTGIGTLLSSFDSFVYPIQHAFTLRPQVQRRTGLEGL